MSDSPVPAYVDTRKIFQQLAEITGIVPLARLPRFRESLANDEGTIRVELQFVTDESHQRLITGNLHAEVQVICQRCLEPLAIVLQDDIKLALLKDESKAGTLNPEFDPWICADNKLQIANLVEEQLMLCLPIVNLHQTAQCNSEMNYQTEPASPGLEVRNGTADNPFSILKSLKENDGSN